MNFFNAKLCVFMSFSCQVWLSIMRIEFCHFSPCFLDCLTCRSELLSPVFLRGTSPLQLPSKNLMCLNERSLLRFLEGFFYASVMNLVINMWKNNDNEIIFTKLGSMWRSCLSQKVLLRSPRSKKGERWNKKTPMILHDREFIKSFKEEAHEFTCAGVHFF